MMELAARSCFLSASTAFVKHPHQRASGLLLRATDSRNRPLCPTRLECLGLGQRRLDVVEGETDGEPGKTVVGSQSSASSSFASSASGTVTEASPSSSTGGTESVSTRL